MLIDAHNHLQHPDLLIHFGDVLDQLESRNIGMMLINGTTETDWNKVIELYDIYPRWALPSLGLHPWFLNERSPNWHKKLTYFLNKYPIAIGECGLDKWIPDHDLELQQAILQTHLDLAHKYQRPITLHCLKAWGTLLEMLQNDPVPERGFLLHAYGGPTEMVQPFVEMGAYFSFSGYFLEPKKAERLDVFRSIPIERILVETDAPSMPLPEDKDAFQLGLNSDGKRINHPANLPIVYDALAMALGMPRKELEQQAEANFRRLMGPLIIEK